MSVEKTTYRVMRGCDGECDIENKTNNNNSVSHRTKSEHNIHVNRQRLPWEQASILSVYRIWINNDIILFLFLSCYRYGCCYLFGVLFVGIVGLSVCQCLLVCDIMAIDACERKEKYGKGSGHRFRSLHSFISTYFIFPFLLFSFYLSLIDFVAAQMTDDRESEERQKRVKQIKPAKQTQIVAGEFLMFLCSFSGFTTLELSQMTKKKQDIEEKK